MLRWIGTILSTLVPLVLSYVRIHLEKADSGSVQFNYPDFKFDFPDVPVTIADGIQVLDVPQCHLEYSPLWAYDMYSKKWNIMALAPVGTTLRDYVVAKQATQCMMTQISSAPRYQLNRALKLATANTCLYPDLTNRDDFLHCAYVFHSGLDSFISSGLVVKGDHDGSVNPNGSFAWWKV